MIGPFTLAWVLATQGSDDQAKKQAQLKEVVPKWTGSNGYEELVKAAMLLEASDFKALDRYINFRDGSANPSSKEPPGILPSLSVLDLYKLELQEAAPALDLVRAGLRKAIVYPKPVSELTLFPELQSFKLDAKLFSRFADVEFSQGHQEAAQQALTDGLSLAKRIPPEGDLTMLVAISAEKIMFKAISKDLPRLSLAGVSSLKRLADDACAAPEPLVESSRVMRNGRRLTFYDLFEHPNESLGEDPGNAQDIQVLRSISPAERDNLYKAMFINFEAPFKAVEIRLSAPEDTWLAPLDIHHVPGYRLDYDVDALQKLNPGTRVAGVVVLRYLGPLGYDDYNYENVIRVALTRRVKERILALTCSITEFKLRNGKPPATLRAMLGKEPLDPASRGPYSYVANSDGTFHLSCKVPKLGEIVLDSG